MCGRIAQIGSAEDLIELIGVKEGYESISNMPPSYNVAPGNKIIAVLVNHTGNKSWTILKWGMLPNWIKVKRPVINARGETIAQKPMFRDAFHQRRILIPVDAYYEWRLIEGGKQPYCIKRKDHAPLLLAGIHNDNECVIITRPPRQEIAFVHDRMPAIISYKRAHPYLNNADIAHQFLMMEDNGLELDIYPVAKGIGNPTFNNPICLEAI
ncbi:MAG: SOS response-associated peptidase [Bacteroidetes bacterium]|nr:SOS response-associated peptidase [Bacteroidota bacterium]MCY4204158.1 SOS response-associated peptidase [Bacteroidota bacterium]